MSGSGFKVDSAHCGGGVAFRVWGSGHIGILISTFHGPQDPLGTRKNQSIRSYFYKEFSGSTHLDSSWTLGFCLFLNVGASGFWEWGC